MMSIGALLAVLAMGAILNASLPANWHVVTRHSDTPSQVSSALDGLEGEINFRIAELEFARARSLKKADEDRRGIPEPGEETSPAKLAAMAARAPEWEKTAAHADQILKRLRSAR